MSSRKATQTPKTTLTSLGCKSVLSNDTAKSIQIILLSTTAAITRDFIAEFVSRNTPIISQWKWLISEFYLIDKKPALF